MTEAMQSEIRAARVRAGPPRATRTISQLNVFPIKGCRGVPVSNAVIDNLGLEHDRRLMLVDADGVFVSQREIPALATLVPVIRGNAIRVHAAEGDPFDITVNPDAPHRTVRIWREPFLAADQGDAASTWFSNQLHQPVRLVAVGRETHQPIDPRFSPRVGAETAFTDGYPIMVVTEASLADLNARLADPVPMSRFRPCVVVAGGNAWDEDEWRVIALGDVTCDAVKPCARCVVTATDQETGTRHPLQEPLRTLASFRTVQPFGAIFGQNLVPRDTGLIAVGDEVSLL